MKTYPTHPRMKQRIERMSNLGIGAKIPGILAFECEYTLTVYYGGKARAGIALIRKAISQKASGAYWNFIWSLSDKIGWTKSIPIPGCKGFVRHGRNCPWNCQRLDCIETSIPHWYRKITGMMRHDL